MNIMSRILKLYLRSPYSSPDKALINVFSMNVLSLSCLIIILYIPVTDTLRSNVWVLVGQTCLLFGFREIWRQQKFCSHLLSQTFFYNIHFNAHTHKYANKNSHTHTNMLTNTHTHTQIC